MAIAAVTGGGQAPANNGGTTSSLTFAFDAQGAGGASDYVLLITFNGDVHGGADDISSVVFDPPGAAQAATLIDKSSVAGSRIVYVYKVMNPVSGSKDITITAGSTHWLYGCAASYSGVKAVGAGVAGSQGGAGTSWSQSLVTTLNNSWVVSGVDTAGGSIGAGASTTLRAWNSSLLDPGFFDNNQAVAASTNVTLNYTSGPGPFAGVIFELQSELASNDLFWLPEQQVSRGRSWIAVPSGFTPPSRQE